ncbi:MAG1140 family protein [Candidatus Mycoplasma mahonii]|uniref:MAG1140 family protein n=1 Tax=Candidatus Mycoplasma mahonii TaxID=3004105 RepID=UPI0026EF9767|nr:hypothetical protein [Candidatus Mycoplasma mahonii]WKX02785.1 hypothetical protein O3I44_01785 [Candidatus Mycoplasma mahonii]
MKLLKINPFYFILLLVVMASFIVVLCLISFLPIEKSRQVILVVNDRHQNSLSVDANTANLLKGNKEISILLNDHVYHAVIKAIVINDHNYDIVIGGMDGKLLPGSHVQATIIYDHTTLLRTLLNI